MPVLKSGVSNPKVRKYRRSAQSMPREEVFVNSLFQDDCSQSDRKNRLQFLKKDDNAEFFEIDQEQVL